MAKLYSFILILVSFHTTSYSWLLTKVRVDGNLTQVPQDSSGRFKKMLWSGSSRLWFWFSIWFSSLFSSLWRQFQVRQLQLVSPSLLWSTTFSALGQDPSICLFFVFFYFLSVVRRNSKIHLMTSSFFLLGSIISSGLGDLSLSRSLRDFFPE